MKVPLRWLRDYVEVPSSPNELAERLTAAGVKVERVEPVSGISGVVAGRIVGLARHPNADKLSVAKVSVGNGSEPLQIVTGAPNVREGDRIPVALVGATLAGGKKIEKAKLRGELSLGMMCSAAELGIDGRGLPIEQQTGVMILDPDEVEVGTDMVTHLGLDDSVLHFELFANRPDLFGIVGIAREVAALFGARLGLPGGGGAGSEPLPKTLPEAFDLEVRDSHLCPFYTARLMEGLRVKPSPLWMQLRLQHAGIRSVNNIVDITNYVMLEWGQPLHAFDADLLEGGKIEARQARPGERIVSIDGEERVLDPWMLVIADARKPVAIAGVMGGKESEITERTRRVLLESATFDAAVVRRASIALGLRSESSRRFEKGLDPHQVLPASHRAMVMLVREASDATANGEIHAPLSMGTLPERRSLSFRPGRAASLLGVEISEREMERILDRLEFELVGGTTGIWAVKVPSFRSDIREEADLMEEVARLAGYGRIPEALPEGVTVPGLLSPPEREEAAWRRSLSLLGLREVVTFGVESPEFLGRCHPEIAPILIENPLSEEQGALRPSLLPGLLRVARHNQRMRRNDLALFELGRIFTKGEGRPAERRSAGLLLAGDPWGDPASFLGLKGVVEGLLNLLDVPQPVWTATAAFPFVDGHAATIIADETGAAAVVGMAGLLDPDFLESLEITGPVYAALLDVERLTALRRPGRCFRPLPRFPEVVQAVSTITTAASGDLCDAIRKAGGEILKEVRVTDYYTGAQIPEGKHSITLSLTFRSDKQTLTDDEVNGTYEAIRAALLEAAKNQGWYLSFRERKATLPGFP